MIKECAFGLCREPAVIEITLTSECGHYARTIMACTTHAEPGRSPMPHICEVCEQKVHILRKYL